MKLLITNDDGVYAPGIIALASFFAGRGNECVVVAPDRERSSVGHAITLNRPLRLWEVQSAHYPANCRAYACDGTPSDSVLLGLEEIMPEPDLVLSGINSGPNLGDDLTYSGTVSAAMEGLIHGHSSLAFSLDIREGGAGPHYATAAMVAGHIVDHLGDSPLPEGVLLNVNVPNLPVAELEGLRITRKGVRLYRGKVNRIKDPAGRECWWVSGRVEDRLEEGSDVWAVANGQVSVTPVHMDRTHFPSIDVLASGGLEKINFK